MRKKLNVAIYARKSVLLKKGDTLHMQEERCIRETQLQYGEEYDCVFKTYTDEKSGKNMDREEMNKLRDDISAGTVDVVCTYKLDRLGRNIADIVNFVKFLEDKEVGLICVEDKILHNLTGNKNDYTSKIIISVLAICAEIERNNIIQRVVTAQDRLARLGFWLGGNAPYGFTSIRVENNNLIPEAAAKTIYILSPDEEKMQVVMFIYNTYYTKELSLQDIALECSNLGYTPMFSQSDLFDQHTIQGILTNVIYVKATPEVYDYLIEIGLKPENISSRECFDGIHGLLSYNKTSKSDEITTVKDKSEWIVAVAPHLGVIEADVWLFIQRKLDSRVGSKTKIFTKHEDVLLAGTKFTCGCCGGTIGFYHNSSKADKSVFYHYYRCELKRRTKGKKCQVRNITGQEVDSLIVSTLFSMKEELVKNNEYLVKHLKDIKKVYKKEVAIPNLQKKKEKKEKEIQDCTNILIEHASSLNKTLIDNINTRVEKLQKEIEEINYKLSITESSIKELEAKKKDLDLIIKKLVSLNQDDFNELDMTEKQAIVSNLIKEVKWDGEHLDIYFHVPKDFEQGLTCVDAIKLLHTCQSAEIIESLEKIDAVYKPVRIQLFKSKKLCPDDVTEKYLDSLNLDLWTSRIRYHRLQKRISARDIAKDLGYKSSADYLGRFEHLTSRHTDNNAVRAVCNYLDVPYKEIADDYMLFIESDYDIKLRDIIRETKLTIKQFSKKYGFSYTTVRDLLHRRRRITKRVYERCVKLFQDFGMPV